MTPTARPKSPRSWNALRHRVVRLSCAAMLCLALFTAFDNTTLAQGRGGIDQNTELDGRLFGYAEKVAIGEKDSTTPLWFVYFFLVVVGCSALFKTAKRE